MNWRGLLTAASLLMLSACAFSTKGEAGLPLKALVVDAETGQPLEGVVVLAYWVRYTASLGGWAGGKLNDSEEAVTGADGRFKIRPRRSYTIPGVTKVTSEMLIFKPGYGRWRHRSAGEDPIVALPPLRTREERLKFYDEIIRPTGTVPPDRMKRLTDAWLEERRYLGLGGQR